MSAKSEVEKQIVCSIFGTGDASGASLLEDENLMVLHARIEPDMQRHLVCADKKVTNFTDILNRDLI